MSQTTSHLDLSQLAVDRTRPATPAVKRRTPWMSRYILPTTILGGFVALFAWSARESFLSAQPVAIIPVTVSRAEIQQAGTPLFQAAGWIEPRPTAVVASSLAPGVIKELLIVEGDRVELGQPVATLIDTDAKLALAEAQSLYAIQLGELQRAKASLAAATTHLEQPVQLKAELANAEAMLAATERELNNLPFAIEAARTTLQLAQENTSRKEKAGDAIMGRLLREARGEQALAEGSLNELIAREPSLRSQLNSLSRRREALADQLSLLTEEKRALADAEANVQVVEARVQQSQLAVQTAELQLERMTVRSPIAGCVLSLEARPGQWLSGMGTSSSQGSSAVVSLYDPSSLQVRVDVRLEDVPQVVIGQPTQIESAALPQAITGKVISVTTQADIQKNTLQVKVAIIEPPTVIKPEMLAKVTFVAPTAPEQEGIEQSPPVRTFVPQALLTQGEGGHAVWVVDLTQGTASQRTVTVGQAMADGNMIEIVSGLSPTDKLIVGGRESLREGARVRVSSEASSVGGV